MWLLFVVVPSSENTIKTALPFFSLFSDHRNKIIQANSNYNFDDGRSCLPFTILWGSLSMLFLFVKSMPVSAHAPINNTQLISSSQNHY